MSGRPLRGGRWFGPRLVDRPWTSSGVGSRFRAAKLVLWPRCRTCGHSVRGRLQPGPASCGRVSWAG